MHLRQMAMSKGLAADDSTLVVACQKLTDLGEAPDRMSERFDGLTERLIFLRVPTGDRRFVLRFWQDGYPYQTRHA